MARRAPNSDVDSRARTVVKAVSYRVLATLTTMTIVFLITRKIIISLGVGLVEVIAKITFYYLHERAWHKISWGKNKHPLSGLPVKRELEPKDMAIVKNKLKELGYLD